MQVRYNEPHGTAASSRSVMVPGGYLDASGEEERESRIKKRRKGGEG